MTKVKSFGIIAFRRGVEIWGAGLPELQFIFDADCSVCISASGEPLRTLESQLFEIERLVENVNEMFIKAAKDVIYFRKTIKEINDSFSRRVIKV